MKTSLVDGNDHRMNKIASEVKSRHSQWTRVYSEGIEKIKRHMYNEGKEKNNEHKRKIRDESGKNLNYRNR